ncbi:MAG: tetratricopeptide repeat protein, partial [Candidatus Poribacteria bacterium]
DEERDVAQARLDAVAPLLTRDVREILTTFDCHGVDDLASLEKMLRFRNVDTSATLPDVIGWAGRILGIAAPEQTSLTTRYGSRRYSGRSVECDGVDVVVPAVARLAVVAPGVTVRGFDGDSLDVIAYHGGVTLENIEASVRAYARTTRGIQFEENSGERRYSGQRPDGGPAIHVVAQDVRGSLLISADTTQVGISDVCGNLHVDNVRGNVTACLTEFDLPEDAHWHITTAHGNIEVELPARRHVGVRLETDWGQLSGEGIDGHIVGDDLPLYIGSAPRSMTKDAQIKLSSVSGDVQFRRLPPLDGFESTPEYRLIAEVDELNWTGAADEALALLDQARDVRLGDPHAWFKLGMMLYDGELHEAALEAFDGCATHGGSVWGTVWAGHMLDLLGRRDEALGRYRAAQAAYAGEAVRHDQYGIWLDGESIDERLVEPFTRHDG